MEKKVINKSDWIARFNLVGRPVIGDYTYKIDERSEKSQWIYNSMNLAVDCGENFGTIYCECLGGYSENGGNKVYVHGKNSDGTDNFKEKIEVAWEDRFNDDILDEVGELSFFKVGLEKTSENKTYYKKFLSSYDAIAYIHDHLSNDMVVNISGDIKYSTYNDNTQVRKNITSIVLSKVENPADFKATFTQSILIDKDSASFKNVDKDKGVMYIDARVLDYVKEINGTEVKGQYPFHKQFEFAMDFSNETACKKIMDKLFKVKKGITQITMEGEFIEGGAVVTATLDDLPEDIKDLIDMGVYSEEEALAKCTTNGNRERRMVLKKPLIKMVGNEDNKVPVVCSYPERYEEEDLILDYLHENKDDDDATADTEEAEHGADLDWLNALG